MGFIKREDESARGDNERVGGVQRRRGHRRDGAAPGRPSRVVEAELDAVRRRCQAGSQVSCGPSLVGGIGTLVLASQLGGDGKAQAHDGGHSGRHHIPLEPETQAVVVCCKHVGGVR